MGIQADIMRTAIEKYLGTEDQWCTHTYAKTADGSKVSPGDYRAVSHCAEGAIEAATLTQLVDLQKRYGPLRWTGAIIEPIFTGVCKVLNEQHPEFAQAHGVETFCDLPGFNDGLTIYDAHPPMIMTQEELVPHIRARVPSVGYQGIKDAFEKYLAICEEKDL